MPCILLSLASCFSFDESYEPPRIASVRLDLVDARATLVESDGRQTVEATFVVEVASQHGAGTANIRSASIVDPNGGGEFTTTTNLDGASYQVSGPPSRVEGRAVGTRAAPTVSPWKHLCQGSLRIEIGGADEVGVPIYAKASMPMTVHSDSPPHELLASSATRLGSAGQETLHSMAADAAGDAWITAHSVGGVDPDGEAVPEGFFVAQIAPNGRRWLRELPHAGFVASAPQAIYLVSSDAQGSFASRLGESGEPIWTYHDEAIVRRTPVADDDGLLVIAMAATGPQVMKLSGLDGMPLFITDLDWGTQQFSWDASTLARDGSGNLYLSATEFDTKAIRLTKIDARGTELWRALVTDHSNHASEPPSLAIDVSGTVFVAFWEIDGGVILPLSSAGDPMPKRIVPADSSGGSGGAIWSLAVGAPGELVLSHVMDGAGQLSWMDTQSGSLLESRAIGCGGFTELRRSLEAQLLGAGSFRELAVAGNDVLRSAGEHDLLIAWLER